MNRRDHLCVAVAALSEALVSIDESISAIDEVGACGGEADPEVIWVRPGRLARAALVTILEALPRLRGARTGVTLPLGAARGATGVIADPVPDAASARARLARCDTLVVAPDGRGAERDDSPAPTPAAPRYARAGRLAGGGMGEVYECEDRLLGRRVAVKALRPELQADLQAVSLLTREARLTASLAHPNIIPVHDVGVLPGFGPAYVMRLVSAPTLADVLGQLADGDAAAARAYGLGRLLRHFIQVCHAVDFAHSRGVVHCDLKPANVLLGSFGQVLVVDWGLAAQLAGDSPPRGGTPGYLAPEQLRGDGALIDARTDVFALGAVLYEIACLKPAFAAQSRSAVLEALTSSPRPWSPPARPAAVAPERVVPEELEEIVLRCLEDDPGRRFPSAQALAQALESFLEGTRERARRAARAEAHAGEGDTLAAAHRELLESRPQRVAEVDALRRAVAPWDPVTEKRTLWDAEDCLAVLDSIAMRTMQAAIAAYEQALDEVSGHPGARRGLARLYFAELERAQDRGDGFDRAYFEELVRQYDDGTMAQLTAGQGTLRLAAVAADGPADARVTLERLEERDRRVVAVHAVELGPCPTAPLALSPGPYRARVRWGARDVPVPVLVRPGRDLAVTVDLGGAADLEPGEVFVAGGVALLGGDAGAGEAVQEVHVPGFIIDALPVSFAAYLEFVAAVFATAPGEAARLVPQSGHGEAYWRWTGSDFVPGLVARWGGERGELLRLPVFGVDAGCALAYAAWRTRRSPRLADRPDAAGYRLPTSTEWEKAARGVDGRRYPWGNRFDAGFCCMRDASPGAPRPAPSGTFPADESPYGVRDLAGGVAEWTAAGAPGGDPTAPLIVRGGAWCDWPSDCVVTVTRTYRPNERSARVGFRLARSV